MLVISVWKPRSRQGVASSENTAAGRRALAGQEGTPILAWLFPRESRDAQGYECFLSHRKTGVFLLPNADIAKGKPAGWDCDI